ncbi:MAG TPA: cation-efflux pump [Porphyromonadaceae bacterium]|nr:cation-efflux pump [Porphyromonadaceae bacterium]
MDREREIYKVTLVGSVGNVLLLIFKFVAAIVGHSSAMMADAVHSLSDFVTDVIVLVFVHVSAKPQDRSHDYGHGKFETFATFVIGLALIAAAVGIIAAAISKVVLWAGGTELKTPGMLALWAALLSIVVKEALYHYTVIRGRALASPAMIANAWHHRSDALSSVGAAVGIGGAILLGSRWAVLDPVASIVVGLMLVRVAYKMLRASVDELTESSLPEEEEQEISAIINSVAGISEPHNLRTRRIGNRVAIEVHIRMDGDVPLTQAHDLATDVERKLKERFGQSTHVSIHMEPIKSVE